MLGAVLITLVYCLAPFVLFFGGKWIYAIIIVLAGCKDGLYDCNLCEDDPPLFNEPVSSWQDYGNGYYKRRNQ